MLDDYAVRMAESVKNKVAILRATLERRVNFDNVVELAIDAVDLEIVMLIRRLKLNQQERQHGSS